MSGISIGESLFVLLVFVFFLIALRVATTLFKSHKRDTYRAYREALRSMRPPPPVGTRPWPPPPPPPTPKMAVPKQETKAAIEIPTERLIREE